MASPEPDSLRKRITTRELVVGIIGMGYVGLPLALAAADAGIHTLGFDIDAAKVAGLNDGISPLRHIASERIGAARATGRLAATNDFQRLGEPDAILICVPTPLGCHREPDLSFVENSAREIALRLRPGQLVVLESTTWPGTTREVVKPILEGTGLRCGHDIFLAYSPEREDPGNATFDTAQIPKVVGGDDSASRELACALYDQFVRRTVPVSSTEVAEAVKLTENIFRAVNIALVNELKIVFQTMRIDIFEVIEAAKTKPFGYMPFYPGPGLGGHCIPIDPFYLTWKAHEYGLLTKFIELAGEINTAMPSYVVNRLALALDQRFGKGLNGARILTVGVAYKKNIDDTRESPAFAIMEKLEARGASVAYHDPLVPVIPPTRKHSALAGRRSLPLTADILAGFDAVVIVTDHDAIDWKLLKQFAHLIIDSRNRLGNVDRVYPA